MEVRRVTRAQGDDPTVQIARAQRALDDLCADRSAESADEQASDCDPPSVRCLRH
jgi:hypothetical protein